jgi:AraC-like DNA-binding protein
MHLTKYSFEEWRYMASPFWEVSLVNEPDRFYSKLAFSTVQDLVIGRSRFAAQVFDHNPSAIRGIDHEYVYVERYLSGHARGLAENTSTRLDGNIIQLIDLTRRYRSITSDVCAVGTLIPHAAIGFDPGRHPNYISLSLDTPAGRVLAQCHQAFLDAEEAGSPDVTMWAQSFKHLVRSLMLREIDEEMREDAPMVGGTLARSFIERHLDDPELSVNRLCAHLGMSRSVLYRLFEHDGGVAGYIRDRRLDRCFDDLLDTPPDRGRVRRVAQNWSFFDPANFNRAFRARFGVAPSDCVVARASNGARRSQMPGNPIHDWMGKG